MPSIPVTRRATLGAALLATLGAPPGARAAEPVHGGILTVLVNPEPPYLLSALDPSLQIGTVCTKMMEGLLSDDADMQRRGMTDVPLIPLMEMRFITVGNRHLANHTVGIDGVVGSNFASVYFAPAP